MVKGLILPALLIAVCFIAGIWYERLTFEKKLKRYIKGESDELF